jgi:multiple sugar transport system ATP-binding protein
MGEAGQEPLADASSDRSAVGDLLPASPAKRDRTNRGGSLHLADVNKSFGIVHVLKGVDLAVEPGEFVVFVGPSGCGKSTLLRIIAGLEEQTSGDLRIGGVLMNGVPPAKRGIAMVFQSYALYPHLTVEKNMGLALAQAGVPSPEIRARVAKASGLLRLDALLGRRPAELSGGQRQRVAIGRAIVREPSLFLFDEPLSNLDAALRVGTRIEIAKLHRQLGATMVYVTHDQIEAMTLADKIVVMRGGAIEQVGRPLELYHRPANLFVAGFIGSPTMNFADGAIAARAGATTIGVRPEHLVVVPEGAWTGTVSHAEHLGADTMLYVEVPGMGLLTARVLGDVSHDIGDRVGLTPQDGKIYRFDGAGNAIG